MKKYSTELDFILYLIGLTQFPSFSFVCYVLSFWSSLSCQYLSSPLFVLCLIMLCLDFQHPARSVSISIEQLPVGLSIGSGKQSHSFSLFLRSVSGLESPLPLPLFSLLLSGYRPMQIPLLFLLFFLWLPNVVVPSKVFMQLFYDNDVPIHCPSDELFSLEFFSSQSTFRQ